MKDLKGQQCSAKSTTLQKVLIMLVRKWYTEQ